MKMFDVLEQESRRSRQAERLPKAHFKSTIEGAEFACIYTRKNACSALMRLFRKESPLAGASSKPTSNLEFMLQHDRIALLRT
jgi:hypothetical protein